MGEQLRAVRREPESQLVFSVQERPSLYLSASTGLWVPAVRIGAGTHMKAAASLGHPFLHSPRRRRLLPSDWPAPALPDRTGKAQGCAQTCRTVLFSTFHLRPAVENAPRAALTTQHLAFHSAVEASDGCGASSVERSHLCPGAAYSSPGF